MFTSSHLSNSVIKGSFWVLAMRITSRGLGILRTVVLARLLFPEDFGLIGLAMLTISTIETFSQPGFAIALIQKKSEIETYLDTVWTVSVIRSLIIYLILFFSAPHIARFFEAPQAEYIMRVFGLSVIIAGCRNSGVVLFQKALDFKKQYIYELSTLIGNILVTIPAAFIYANVWALVFGGIAGSITRFMMSYILHPFRPRLRLEKDKFLELFTFGRWIFCSSILTFLVSQGDDIFLGKVFGVAALGLYQMAFMVSNLPTTETSRVISYVTFPAYSQIQNDVDRLRNAYFKVLQVVLFISIPIAGTIFIFAQDAIYLLLSEKWIAVVPLLKILILAGLTQAFIDTTGSVFNACGKPKINTKWQLASFLVLLVLMYPISSIFGSTGVAIVVVTANIIAAAVSFYELRKVFSFELSELLRPLLCPLASMTAAAVVVIHVRSLLQTNNPIGIFFLISIGAVLYSLITLGFDKVCNYRIQSIIKETYRSLRANQL